MSKALNLRLILIAVILINLFLNIFGNTWGLPSRWHSDEQVAAVLHMANERKIINPVGDQVHPTGYNLFLLASLAPAYLYLKLINYPLAQIKEAASLSWIHMAGAFPGFASGIYIYARSISAILGALTVYVIYLLGKEVYDERAGLFSAAFLSVCMGFIGTNHFAKYKSLVNLLIALTILFCAKSQKASSIKSRQRFLFFASFAGGLAISVHTNALLLLLPLSLTFIFTNFYKGAGIKRVVLICLGCMLLYSLGVILGTPSLLINSINYFSKAIASYMGNPLSASLRAGRIPEKAPLFIGPLNYFFELLSIYGIPIFILILSGIVARVLLWRQVSKKEIIVFSFAFAYYFIMTVIFKDKYPQTKHIIAIVPLLAILAGKFMADISLSKRIAKILSYSFFSAAFIYSLAYSFKADLHFKSGDPRYKSTRWIIENIPKGSKIEVFDQLNYVASATIFNDYEIIYLGRSSKQYQGKNFFKWNTVKNREGYLRNINKYDSASDYILANMRPDALERLRFSVLTDDHIPGRSEYLASLFDNKKNFRIVKIIEPENREIESKKIKGFFHFENLWWVPIPSYRATANTIYIFKRINEGNAKGKIK